MASIATCGLQSLLYGVTWCFCTATASLFGSCCGNDKPSTVPPSVTSGRKRSVLLLIIAIGCALAYQYGVAPAIIDPPTYAEYTPGFNYIKDSWIKGCEKYDGNSSLTLACAGNNGVYRASFAAMLFYALAAIAVACKPTANREAWPAKFVLFLFLVVATAFIPNDPLFNKITMNIARIGGIVFVLIQQFVIIDLAYNWNESWVEKADECEKEEIGSGKKWLAAILASCALLFIVSIASLAAMFIYFTGCTTNNIFIGLTLVLCVALTAAQLMGEQGSLLSSACVSAWAVYLLYSAVTKNPDSICNPALGGNDTLSIALALVITIISMAYTGWSYTAEGNVSFGRKVSDSAATTPSASDAMPPETVAEEKKDTSSPKIGGHVTGVELGTDDNARVTEEQSDNDSSKLFSNSWLLNVILISITSWAAMSLTQWGKIADQTNVANPSVGYVGMWIIIGSQWLALSLYIWTLIAPIVFPDRDFS